MTGVSEYTLQYPSDSDSDVPVEPEKDDVTSLWNKVLAPDQFDFLIKKSGMSPTLDVSPNPGTSTLPNCCSGTETFLLKDLAGQCVFMAPPAHNPTIEDYLSHYLEQKARHPDISGVFVLPLWRHTQWAAIVEDKLELLHVACKGHLDYFG